jgi:hypothetical protein
MLEAMGGADDRLRVVQAAVEAEEVAPTQSESIFREERFPAKLVKRVDRLADGVG